MKKAIQIILRVVIYGALMGLCIYASKTLCLIHTFKSAFSCYDCDWKNANATEIDGLSYGPGEMNTYDLFLPNDKSASKLLLFIHGGGFTGGDKGGEGMFCKWYTSHGYVCASCNYTLASKETPSNVNKMYEELAHAVTVIREECASRGYTLTQMATSGESAGGCLAMLLGYRGGDTLDIPVKFVFQMVGPVDFTPEIWGINEIELIELLTGKKVSDEMIAEGKHHDLLEEVTPAALARKHYVPTIMAYGPKDKVVPPELKYKLINYLEQNNLPFDYIEFPNSGHGLLADHDCQRQFRDKAIEYCNKYFD